MLRKVGLIGEAIVFLGLSAWLTWYVAREDDYRRDGISRWSTYDAQPITVVAIVSGVIVAAFAIYSVAREQKLAGINFLMALGSVAAFYVARASMTN